MPRVRLTVAYDGRDFHGFAANPGVRTVMGDLSAAIATVVRRPVELTGAGRTDAGVHAWGQVVSGDLPDRCRPRRPRAAPQQAVRAGDRGARRGVGRRRLRRPVLGDVPPLPLRRLERPDAEPAARRPGLVRAPAAGALGDDRRVRPTDRRARLLVVLPPAAQEEGPDRRRARAVDGPRVRRPLVRARRRCAPSCIVARGLARLTCASRSGRRRSATRWSARSSGRSSTSASARRHLATSVASSSPATARRPARSPRRTASCCGRSVTHRRPYDRT